ncbi:oligosaccharide flippase family protein [Rhizorhapis suberifaciens]|uniref:O-antigen/teichoic acid export membrane protein n=1 Tax=Rhizorhapis suberifaciens TaxID=13656 RepID=A0A840HUQ6_9SPHN|nr:oligosaccharide flippase family protein [Rhizorhapis suberifaciens]MBB4641278.1 O-antigen/teichoic acid export membrane protein [Rhizorhapis suberifaciens]
MSGEREPPRRGTKAFLAASGVAQICALARYTVLARILGPEQLGLAAILILTAQFFDSVTDSGSDRFLVQDRDGNDRALLGLTHLVSIGRGIAIALGLIILSGPIASLSGAPQLAPDIVVLAIAPLLMGLVHWDYRRQQRESDFRGEGRIVLAAEVVSLIVTTGAALAVRDFTAILYGLIARSLVTVLMSHLVARQRYAARYASEYASRLTRFAWPLMINGLLIFIGGQGDRIFISNQLGVAALGHYSAVILLIYYPSAMLMRFMTTMFLPRISDRRDVAAWKRAYAALGGQTMLAGLAMQFGFVLVAPLAVPLLYGEQFAVAWLDIALIATLQSARFVRMWPVTAAIGLGRSHIVMIGNAVRMIAFPAAFAGLMLIDGIEGIVAGFVLAELLAFVLGLAMANRALEHPFFLGGTRLFYYVAGSALLIAFVLFQQTGTWSAAAMCGALLVIWAFGVMRAEWNMVQDILALVDRATGHRLVPAWLLHSARE